MKRTLSVLLALAMLFAFAACAETPGTDPASEDEAVGTEQSAPVSGKDEESEDAVPSTSAPSTDTLPEFSKAATIEETVMVDENDVRITATGLSYNDYAAELELTIENNSDKNLSFISGSMGYSCNSVNGMMVADGYLNCDVMAGKKAVDTISLSYDTLQLYGIQEIADIEIGFNTADDDYNYTYFAPRQVTTSAYGDYDYDRLHYQETITGAAAQNSYNYELLFFATDKLYERDGISAVSQALVRNADGELSFFVELENRSEDLRIVSVSDIFMNGLLVNDTRWSSDTIAPGKRAVVDIALSSVLDVRYWELCGIEDVGSISFALQQSDIDWNELTEQEPVAVHISEAGTLDTSGTEVYNQNGVRIASKGIVAPASEYDSYFNVLLLAENTGSEAVKLRIPSNVMSVNGFMVGNFGETWELQAGRCALMEIPISARDLEEIEVTEAEQITEAEFELEIKQGNALVDTPVIKMAS